MTRATFSTGNAFRLVFIKSMCFGNISEKNISLYLCRVNESLKNLLETFGLEKTFSFIEDTDDIDDLELLGG